MDSLGSLRIPHKQGHLDNTISLPLLSFFLIASSYKGFNCGKCAGDILRAKHTLEEWYHNKGVADAYEFLREKGTKALRHKAI